MFGKFFGNKQEANNTKMTKDESYVRDSIQRALDIKCKERICECCGCKAWYISECIGEHRFHDIKYNSKCYTMATTICKNCGNMKNFAINELFLLKK
jgi:hypothetical protein